MIENTDAEQVERLNSRIVELLQERDALVKALEQIAEGTTDENYPFRAIGRDQMKQIARAALDTIKRRT